MKDLKLAIGEGKARKETISTESNLPREKSSETFGGLMKQINEIFEDTAISNEDKANVFESIRRYTVSYEQVQRESLANCPAGFSSSPT